MATFAMMKLLAIATPGVAIWTILVLDEAVVILIEQTSATQVGTRLVKSYAFQNRGEKEDSAMATTVSVGRTGARGRAVESMATDFVVVS